MEVYWYCLHYLIGGADSLGTAIRPVCSCKSHSSMTTWATHWKDVVTIPNRVSEMQQCDYGDAEIQGELENFQLQASHSEVKLIAHVTTGQKMSLPVPLNVLAAQQTAFELLPDHDPAGLPVANPTKSFWINSANANPLAKEGSVGDLTIDADVCIIGSGVTGVSAAYHLSKAIKARGDTTPQFKAVILDARDFCGFQCD